MKLKRVESDNPEHLAFRSKMCPTVIGAGLFLIAMGAAAYYFDFPKDEDAPPWIPQAVGIGLMAFGGAMASLRSGAVIDRSAMTIRRWHGPGFPIFWLTKRIEPLAVRIRKMTFRYRQSHVTTFPIRVLNNGSYVQLGEVEDPMHAWCVAEAVATFLKVPVYDESHRDGE